MRWSMSRSVQQAMVVALSLLPAVVGAQQLRGAVRDSVQSNPISAAVAQLYDSAGTLISRTIADGQGRFTLQLSPRAASLRVVRIGFQPRDIPITPGSADVSITITMSHLPPVLEAVKVSGSELCPGSTDKGAAFQLWDQARAGLLASVVAREAKPADVTTLTYDRDLSADDGLVRSLSQRTKTGKTTRPFVAAAPAAVFATRGYMTEDTEGRIYSAPDADVLLDDSFASTHCFHLEKADRAHLGEVGLAFTPSSGRDTLVDVTGVVWIDGTTPALRSLDFHYTGLEPAAMKAGVGGKLEFVNLPNGVSFISRWTMRLPMLQASAATARGDAGRGFYESAPHRQNRSDIVLGGIAERGGQVSRATWQDGTVWNEDLSSIKATITQRTTGQPIPFALATISGAADTVTADAHGEVTITPVVAGRYTVITIDTTFGAYVTPRVDTRKIDVARGQVATYQVQFAPTLNIVADLCKGRERREGTAALVGQVTLLTPAMVKSVAVTASWQADYNLTGMGEKKGVVTIANVHQDVELDASGRFIICGVVRERGIHLRMKLAEWAADTTVTVYDSLFKRVDWRPIPIAAPPHAPPH